MHRTVSLTMFHHACGGQAGGGSDVWFGQAQAGSCGFIGIALDLRFRHEPVIKSDMPGLHHAGSLDASPCFLVPDVIFTMPLPA